MEYYALKEYASYFYFQKHFNWIPKNINFCDTSFF